MDTLLNSIGQFGRYQKRSMILIGTISILRSIVTYSSVFIVAKPKFTCKNELEINITYQDNCKIFSDSNNLKNSTFKCEFDDTYYKSTLVTEWHLLCDDIFLASFIQTIFMVGTFASLFNGLLSDRFGRKRVLLISSIILIIVFLVNSILQIEEIKIDNKIRYVSFCVSQFFSGLCTYIMYTSSYILLIELTSAKYSTFVTNFNLYNFVFGEIIVMIISYFTRDWRILNWSITLYSILILILIIFLIPESPRFYMSKNRLDDAIHILNKIAKVNGNQKIFKTSDIEFIEMLGESTGEATKVENKKSNSLVNFLTNPFQNLIMTLLLTFIWTALALIYYGVGLGITTLGDVNPYIVYFLSAIFELIGYISGYLNEKINRKKMFMFYLSFASLMCLGVTLVPENKPARALTWNSILITVFALIGKASASGAFNSAYVYTSLLYPTEFRNTFVLFVSSFGKLGSIVSPQINLLQTLVWRPLPYIIFSSASFIASLFVFFLPDTKAL